LGQTERSEWTIWRQTCAPLALEDSSLADYTRSHHRWSRPGQTTLAEAQRTGTIRSGHVRAMAAELTSRPASPEIKVRTAAIEPGDTTGQSERVPVSPEEIANDAIAAARAGASVVHIHVRDLETKQGSREVAHYREVVRRIRAADVDPVINLTAGMGGDLVVDPQDPLTTMPGTDLINALDRLPHVEELLPEICTIDCGTLNFGEGSNIYVSTPDMIRAGSKRIQALGVRPELEIFDTGNLWFANVLVEEGLIDAPPLYQLCMGIPYGAPADPGLLAAMVDMLPTGAQFTSFAIGANQLPWVAQ